MNGQIIFRRDGDWMVGTAEIVLEDGRTQRVEGRVNIRQARAYLAPLICRACRPELAAAAAGSQGGFGDAFVGATLKQKRDRLKAKQRQQGGYLSPADAHELARLRAKIKRSGGGLFGKLAHAVRSTVNKVARVKILRDIAKQAKGLLKLPGVSQALTVAAAAFPPLGVPALVAFKAANTALEAYEKGGPTAAAFMGQVRQLRNVARRRDRAGLKARKALKVLAITRRWRKGLHAAQRQAAPVSAGYLPPAQIPDVGFMLRGC